MGIAGTITVGTVTTGAPGSSVIVTNRGTATAAILDFTIPQGLQGERGPAGGGGGVGTESVVLPYDNAESYNHTNGTPFSYTRRCSISVKSKKSISRYYSWNNSNI